MMRDTIRKIIMIIAIIVFLFSSFMVLKYFLQMQAGAELTETISEMVVVLPTESAVYEVTDPVQPEIIEETIEKEHTPPPIQVDFDSLCSQNQDVVAWLYCPDTVINYPVVQASDNEYYLNRLLDGRRNVAGTLFVDYRNSGDFTDWNTVIYGHHMKNKSMFGSLTKYKKQAYFDLHPVMYLLTPDVNYKINILAGFVTPGNSELYNALNPDEEKKLSLFQSWKNDSTFDAELDSDAENRFITLSTCSYEYRNARYVLIGVLEEL